MRPTLSLIRREFTAYFLSPIAYVVLAALIHLPIREARPVRTAAAAV